MSEPAQNSDRTLASSAASSNSIPPPPPVQPREVFPVTMEKDYKDFRGLVDKDFSGTSPDESDPKALSAPESVVTQGLPTGLEDVSEEDLANLVQQNAVKVTTPTSIEETSAG